MTYSNTSNFKKLVEQLELYAQLQSEYGAKGINALLAKTTKTLRDAVSKIRKLPIDQNLAKQEPSNLAQIQTLRPTGPRRIWNTFNRSTYNNRLEGALLGRMAGCTLGVPVEAWTIDMMKALAEENGDSFPPTDFWSYIPDPKQIRYKTNRHEEYTRNGMNGVPVDDDIAYTLIGLLIAEEHGPAFSIVDVGKTWIKYLPCAYTAEDVALKNLKKGVPSKKAGEKNNPYCEWIGAAIRSDPWGYMAPGWPERAAAMAYTDAYISHRRQGIYGEMFFAATISTAFAVDDPIEAIHIGLTEIPRYCTLAKAVRWALQIAPEIKNYRQARVAIDAKFKGMHHVHTINNACLTILGITIGGKDFTKVIGETVAMGMDNDCTSATAGSIVGEVVGKDGIPKRWYKNFNNTIHSYLNGRKRFHISEVLHRFEKQAMKIHSQQPDQM